MGRVEVELSRAGLILALLPVPRSGLVGRHAPLQSSRSSSPVLVLIIKLAIITTQRNITFVQSSGQSSIPQHLQLPLVLKFVSDRVFDILTNVRSFKHRNCHLKKRHSHKSTIRTYFMFWVSDAKLLWSTGDWERKGRCITYRVFIKGSLGI